MHFDVFRILSSCAPALNINGSSNSRAINIMNVISIDSNIIVNIVITKIVNVVICNVVISIIIIIISIIIVIIYTINSNRYY